jgi:RNA polymerase sigma factor (sigma-70 family)
MVRHIRGTAPDQVQATEDDLFFCMHACGYRAARPERGASITRRQRKVWSQRWWTIREHIVQANLGLVYSILRRHTPQALDPVDLQSEAMLAFTKAVDRYNPWKGFRFSTYAYNAISRAVFRRLRRQHRFHEHHRMGFEPSLDDPVELPDHKTELYVDRLRVALDRNLGELTEIESRILSRRFPQDRDRGLTFREIGREVGLSKERVRQIQQIALDKLREVLDQDTALK